MNTILKNKIFSAAVFLLSFAVVFLPGCTYLSNLDEAMFLKNFDNNQKEMQAEIDKEEESFSQLKADIKQGRLPKARKKRRIFTDYGEPSLCKPAENKPGIKETCIYRKPTGGLEGELILLNFDARSRLASWEIQE